MTHHQVLARPAHRRHVIAVVAWLAALLPVSARAFATLEVDEWSRGSPGAAVAPHGYFKLDDPTLVSHSKTTVPVGDGTGDVMVEFDYRYSDGHRVNASHFGGGTLLPPLVPQHSFAKASGYADAGTNTLGGYRNLGAFAFVTAGELGSTAAALATASVDFTFVVGPGSSGAAVGAPASGLRWEFSTDGDLSVAGTSYPQSTLSAASGSFHGIVLRGAGATCGPFACPKGAYAASVDLSSSVYANTLVPGKEGDPTGEVRRDRTWRATDNSVLLAGGTVIKEGGEYGHQVLVAHGKDSSLNYVAGLHTGASPLGLDYIDFNATVGETLRLQVQMTAAASLDGVGWADADLFGSFTHRVFDPLGRGYDITFSVAPLPVPEPAAWGMFAAGLVVLWASGRRRPGMAAT